LQKNKTMFLIEIFLKTLFLIIPNLLKIIGSNPCKFEPIIVGK